MTPDMNPDTLFLHTAVPHLAIDPYANTVVDANLEACRLLRRDRVEIRAMPASALFCNTCLPALMVFSEEVITRQRGHTDQLRLRVDDDSREVEATGRTCSAGDQTVLHLALQPADELEQRRQRADADRHYHHGIGHWGRMARVFREFEWKNRLLLDAAGEGIYGVDRDGNTTFVNPAAQRILGYSVEELAGRNMHTTVHHSHGDGSHYRVEECPIFEALRDGKVHTVEDDVFWSKHGKPIDVEYTSTPVRENDEIVGVVVIFRDVSQRKADQHRLLEALEEVRSLKNRLEMENAYLQEEINSEYNHHRIIGRSAGVRNIIRQIDLVAPTEATVLIYGESGTGKELIARSIHESSHRSGRALIRVNCAAVPDDLFESEFFGHVKGAFTGATHDRAGRFELADGGTLFLDEVGEIPLHLQGKLLRVLQEQQFERIGDSATRTVDVRIVAATNKDLRQLVQEGRFREDLFFRLSVFPIESVPLRERKEDIPLLARLFLDKAATRAHKPTLKMSLGDLEKLQAYDWPGNIRELENAIERLVILAPTDTVRVEDNLLGRQAAETTASDAPEQTLERESDLRRRQRQSILHALEAAQGKVFGPAGAAEMLGLKPTTLASRIKRLGIEPRQFKPTPGARETAPAARPLPDLW
jgi:PAS domain S-box-containing protein